MRAVWPRWIRHGPERIAEKLAGLNASSARIAAGFGIGVAVACTPLIGLHLVLSILLAACLRASIPAAVIGSFAANPWTYAPLLGAGFALGCWLAGEDASASMTLPELAKLGAALWSEPARAVAELWPLLARLFIGSLALAAPMGTAAALFAFLLLRRYMPEPTAP